MIYHVKMEFDFYYLLDLLKMERISWIYGFTELYICPAHFSFVSILESFVRYSPFSITTPPLSVIYSSPYSQSCFFPECMHPSPLLCPATMSGLGDHEQSLHHTQGCVHVPHR